MFFPKDINKKFFNLLNFTDAFTTYIDYMMCGKWSKNIPYLVFTTVYHAFVGLFFNILI